MKVLFLFIISSLFYLQLHAQTHFDLDDQHSDNKCEICQIVTSKTLIFDHASELILKTNLVLIKEILFHHKSADIVNESLIDIKPRAPPVISLLII